jgi:hypothetical protein
VRPTEKKFGSGRVRTENRDNDKFTVDTFDPNSPGEDVRQNQQDRSPQDRNRNRNPRNARRNPKPREFQHPTLENLIIPKASVQDRLMKISMNSNADPEVKAEPETPPIPETTPAMPAEEIKNGD